ncbi:DNA repair protein XRCC3-like [Uloborus diversus]|uniref:DNA repair protein XRCC3-like n=1 Tax=Uloborus diversus TaxID=327109 RepID=UPI00240996A5|nr:DNA repair protein XRCC3-like [Uloborus diversus]
MLSSIMSGFNSTKLQTVVDNLPVNPTLIAKLKAGNLCSLKKILHLSIPELQKCAKVSKGEAKIIIEAVSHAVLETDPISGFDIFYEPSSKEKLSLDSFKNFDGIYGGTITEICGESGCGKTQLCLHLSILAQLPQCYKGLNAKILYIHSEGDFPIKRYMQMTEQFKQKCAGYKALNLSDNLILKKVSNLKETMHVLQQSIPDLLKKEVKPKILVIDSVAAVLRCEYESMNMRTLLILQLVTQLWNLANNHQMFVICVNQISGSVQQATDVPALGLLWANALTTRLKISRASPNGEIVPRILEVIFSSYHARVKSEFIISRNGIEPIV